MKEQTNVQEVALDKNTIIYKASKTASFIDVFQMKTKRINSDIDHVELMRYFFKSFPAIFVLLLALRDIFARLFSLKRSSGITKSERLDQLDKFQGHIGEAISLFEVLDKNEQELMTGQKDSHLDFKLSFISYKKNGLKYIELATVVHFNNSLGKLYFAVVKPFHKYFVKRILLNMEENIMQTEAKLTL